MNDESALERISALANKSRWEIFWLLVGEQCMQKSAGEIGERLNIAPATLSFHLKELTHAGLLHATRSGSRRLYAPDCAAVVKVAEYLVNKCGALENGDNGEGHSHTKSLEARIAGQEWVR